MDKIKEKIVRTKQDIQSAHWTTIYVFICMLVILGASGTFIYWKFYPFDVIEIENENAVEVDKQVYQAGDRITYTLKYCKKMKVAAVVQRQLVDGIRIYYTAIYNSLNADIVGVTCSKTINADLVIPDFVSSGLWHIETSAEYQVNPLRKITENWRSVDFMVENVSNDKTQINNDKVFNNK